MHKVIVWSKSYLGIVVLGDVFLTLILPWIFKFFGASVPLRIGLLFIILDMVWAVWRGRFMRRGELKWWWSLLMPLLFALMVLLRFAHYDYWFVPIYWVLTMLSFTRD